MSRTLAAILGAGLLALAAPAAPSALAAAGEEWAGSDACHTCHRDRFGSWHRTFHRTMTQTAGPESVQGRFDGREVTHWGVTVRPVRRGDEYWFEYYRPGESEPVAEYRVERTVGSNRYQQYLTRAESDGTYFRLHLLWHNGEERWIHMNAAFLGPDDQEFDDNVSVWNHNCIFCHNTGPQPRVTNYDEMLARAAAGEPVDSTTEARFASRVAELGIACETCHGPGADHVEKQSNTFTRLFYTVTGTADDTIVQPDHLDTDAATQVCGQCHGQRIPKSQEVLQTFINDGPVYRAGDDLFESVDLVWPETRLPVGDHPGDLFRLRFWGDRTPRLTAYEYQGLKLSACHEEGELTCMNCHAMHDGDRHGMIEEADRGDRPCLECHRDLAADVSAHTGHEADGEGSRCYGCHMPEVAYGVMEIHRSHHIEIPDPAAHANAGRPNACNLCHLDRSVEWAETETARMWDRPARPVRRPDTLDADVPDGIARLHAGDPVERAVTAVAIGRAAERGVLEQSAIWPAHLLRAMEDNFPAVRRFAARSLEQVGRALGGEAFADARDRYDFVQPANGQEQALARLMDRYRALVDGHPPAESGLGPDWRPAAAVEEMRAIGAERSREINIGE